MEKNVGMYESIVRGVIGAGALTIGVAQRNPLWMGISALTFASALTRVCPINAAFGINTYEKSEGTEETVESPTVPTIH